MDTCTWSKCRGRRNDDGSYSSPVCRARCFKTGCEGLRPDCQRWSHQSEIDSDDLGGGHQSGTRTSGPSHCRTGHPGRDGGHQRLLEAVLLSARGRSLRGDAVNARHVKNLPGRKPDVSDAAWLAQLGAHGLVRGSFAPPEPIRQLRDLTRTRTTLVRARAKEIQRLEKLLEDAGIKLSSVASDITGPSGRSILEALIEGPRDPGGMDD